VKSNMLIAIALLSLAGVVVPARAQEGKVPLTVPYELVAGSKIAVTVPFEFVAGGRTLPAGRYTISEFGTPGSSRLLISTGDRGVSVISANLDTTQFGDASLRFDQVAGAHLLSQIKTSKGTYAMDNRGETERLTKLAQSNDHTGANGMTTSGQ